VELSLLDIENRLYDLSFDPNHAPELRWGAKPGSTEAETAVESATPLANGGLVPMKEAYAREAYYRSLPQRESEPSYLKSMFTEGFPVRMKMQEEFASKWLQKHSPPLVPHQGLSEYVKGRHQTQTTDRPARVPKNTTAKTEADGRKPA